MGQFDDVNTPSLAYEAMASAGRWGLLDDLESTIKMIAAGDTWLSRFSGEPAPDYELRLHRNSLHGMFSRASRALVSKPFSRPIKYAEGVVLPDGLERLLTDIDGDGTGLSEFFKSVFSSGSKYGLGHVLVNYSFVEQNAPGASDGETVAMRGDLQKEGARARAFEISPVNLIAWETRMDKGQKVIDSVRYRGIRTVRSGFSEEEVATVTHYNSQSIDRFEKDGGGVWQLVSSVAHTFGRVPLESFYTGWRAFMEAIPPYLSLAETNLKHWQISAGYYTLLDVVPISRFMTWGFDDEEREAASMHGVAKGIHARSKDAGAKWVEHSGKGIESMFEALQKNEDRAASQASQPISREKSSVTATGERRDASDVLCDLHSWISSMERMIVRVMQLAGEWQGDTLPEAWLPKIYRGFSIGREAFEEMVFIQKDADAGRIPASVAIAEGKNRGLYGDDVDPVTVADQGAQEMQDKALSGIAPDDGSVTEGEEGGGDA